MPLHSKYDKTHLGVLLIYFLFEVCTKTRSRTTTIYWRSLMCKISQRRFYIWFQEEWIQLRFPTIKWHVCHFNHSQPETVVAIRYGENSGVARGEGGATALLITD
jgi:hypothetical protein